MPITVGERRIQILDNYIRTLRLLTRKHLGSDRIQDLPA